MTRRAFLTLFAVPNTQLRVLTRESEANEIPKAEGFILSGPLARATDGSDSWTVGTLYLGVPPESALIPSTRVLEGKRVRVTLERA